MNSTPEPPSPPAPALGLPELHSATLDWDSVQRLLNDIEQCAQGIEILPKYAAQGRVPDAAAISLDQARELLADRRVRGLQLRYHYDGAEWWDTLLVAEGLFRIVRIRQDFGSTASS